MSTRKTDVYLSNWYDSLPNPYDIKMKGWTRIHSEVRHRSDMDRFSMRELFHKCWDKIEMSGKKEFLERNGIKSSDARAACIRYHISEQVCLCIMAPLPEDIKALYYLSYAPDKFEWR